MNKKHIFITGATGFFGSNLTKRMLKDPKNYLYVLMRTNLSRSELKSKHRHYLRKIFKKPPKQAFERIQFIKGDLTKENLGISKKDLSLLEKKINVIYHSAALRDFNCSLEKIREINVKGTENLLKLAMIWKKTGNLINVNHISTAYIAGDYKKPLYEEQLNVGQKFKNTYEQSKYEAEKVVHTFRKKHLWIDVFRPSVLTDAINLTNEKLSMLYRMLELYISGLFTDIPTNNTATINLIPVDTAAEIVYRISVCPDRKKNQTYHVINKHPSNMHKVLTVIKKTYNLEKMNLTNVWDKSPMGKHFFEKRFMNFLFPYALQENVFDMKNTEHYIKKYGIKVPKPTEEVLTTMLSGYLRKGLIKFK